MLIKGELRYIQILKGRGTCIDSRLEEIKEQLIRGDKYEQLYIDLLELTKGSTILIPDEYRGYQGGALRYILKVTHEKYFGKPTSCEVELAFAKGFEKGVREGIEFARDFESENEGVGYGKRTD